MRESETNNATSTKGEYICCLKLKVKFKRVYMSTRHLICAAKVRWLKLEEDSGMKILLLKEI